MPSSINVGLTNLQKWYCKTDGTDVCFMCLGGDTLFLCIYASAIDPKNPTALDPNYKVTYAEKKWDNK